MLIDWCLIDAAENGSSKELWPPAPENPGAEPCIAYLSTFRPLERVSTPYPASSAGYAVNRRFHRLGHHGSGRIRGFVIREVDCCGDRHADLGRRALRARGAHRSIEQTLQGLFSAVSKPIFETKILNTYSFENSRRDLHNTHLCTDLRYQFFN